MHPTLIGKSFTKISPKKKKTAPSAQKTSFFEAPASEIQAVKPLLGVFQLRSVFFWAKNRIQKNGVYIVHPKIEWDVKSQRNPYKVSCVRACLDTQVFSARETWVLLEISWILG